LKNTQINAVTNKCYSVLNTDYTLLFLLSFLASVFAETVEAVYRTVAAGFERDFCICAAAGANSRMHFTRRPVPTAAKASVAALLARCPALRTASGLIRKTLFSIKLLLGNSKVKIGATVTASQGFVLIHRISSSKLVCSNGSGDSLIFNLHHHLNGWEG
jgi:hypothetical protein